MRISSLHSRDASTTILKSQNFLRTLSMFHLIPLLTMSRKSFNPHECISLLNTAKQAMQMTDRPFNKETILKSLKGCNLPTNSKFWKSLVNQEFFKKFLEDIICSLTRILSMLEFLLKSREITSNYFVVIEVTSLREQKQSNQILRKLLKKALKRIL